MEKTYTSVTQASDSTMGVIQFSDPLVSMFGRSYSLHLAFAKIDFARVARKYNSVTGKGVVKCGLDLFGQHQVILFFDMIFLIKSMHDFKRFSHTTSTGK